jgi:hypothetical protein
VNVGGASGADCGAVIGALGFALALGLAILAIYSAVRDRRDKRRPDVHAALVIDGARHSSALAFVNAGRALARHVMWLLVESGQAFQGGIEAAFLLPEQTATIPLPFGAPSGVAASCGRTWTLMATSMRVATTVARRP